MYRPLAFIIMICAALAGCMALPTRPMTPAAVQATAAGTAPAVIPERFVAGDQAADELDSLAAWPAPDGRTWVIATAKTADRLLVFDGDSGMRLREFGGSGNGAGQFLRPDGIAIFGDRVFVVERDNHRVQVLSLPDLMPIGSFGANALRSPYGLWLDETGPDEFTAYVTDSVMDGERFDVVPAWSQLDRRVHRFNVVFDDDGAMGVRDAGAFGSTDPATALRIVASIAGDPAHRRLLIADEDTRHESTLREYRFDGRPSGRQVAAGSFRAQAKGIALWDCSVDGGYWIAVDQVRPLTRFLLFDRDTLVLRGVFTGATVANTDGIALHAAATAAFPDGALYAVHDDRAVAAFDLGDVVRALDLDHACAQ